MEEENHHKKNHEIRDWSNMPTDILEMFCKRLTISNQLRFGCVCKSWLSCTTNKSNIWVPETPWLIDNNPSSSRFLLFSNTDHKFYKIYKPFKPLRGSFIMGSFKGWLVIRNLVKLFILNPLSKLRFELPPETTIPRFLSAKGLHSSCMASPIAFAISFCANLNPITIAMVTFGGDLAWCNIRDKAWHGYRPGEHLRYCNLIFNNDKLYALYKDGGKIDIFKTGDESISLLLSLAGTIDSTQSYIDAKLFDVYLVECRGRLLIVQRYYSQILGKTIGFIILEAQEKCHTPQLVKVDILEDHVLFVSNYSIESLHSKHCPGLESNSIYFIEHCRCATGAELWQFSITSGTMFRMPLSVAQFLSPLWILPKFAFECDHNCKCNNSMWIKPKKRRRKSLQLKTNVM